jgi:hypothetical protein
MTMGNPKQKARRAPHLFRGFGSKVGFDVA